MSSVTFLVSAVLTVCVLQALDQNGTKVSIDKINLNAQAPGAVSKVESRDLRLASPDAAQTQVAVPHRSSSETKKIENILPAMQVTNKNAELKHSSAI